MPSRSSTSVRQVSRPTLTTAWRPGAGTMARSALSAASAPCSKYTLVSQPSVHGFGVRGSADRRAGAFRGPGRDRVRGRRFAGTARAVYAGPNGGGKKAGAGNAPRAPPFVAQTVFKRHTLFLERSDR